MYSVTTDLVDTAECRLLLTCDEVCADAECIDGVTLSTQPHHSQSMAENTQTTTTH